MLQARGDEARAVEAILGGQVVLQKQPPFTPAQPAQAAQQQLQQQPAPAPLPQEQPLHDLLRDGFTMSKKLCAHNRPHHPLKQH